MYKTCTQTVEVEIDEAFGKEDCLWITGIVTVEVSVTRDFGDYGSRSDDGPGDPDEVTIEGIDGYELWLKCNVVKGRETEGVLLESGTDQNFVDDKFLLELIPDSSELEVSYEED